MLEASKAPKLLSELVKKRILIVPYATPRKGVKINLVISLGVFLLDKDNGMSAFRSFLIGIGE